MIKRLQSNQAGIVALLTSIIVGTLLIIITSGAIAVMSGELRQASDYDNSIKAYFAAESGAEDAIAHLRRSGDPLNNLKDSCEPYSEADANLSDTIRYTCQIVTAQQNQLTGSLKVEEATQIDLSGTSGYNRLRLQWNQRGSTDPQDWDTGNIPLQFPIGSQWANTYPSVMEVTVISYPQAASFNSADITSQTLVLKPAPSGGTPEVNLGAVPTPVPVNCDSDVTASGGYQCDVNIAGFNTVPGGRNYVIQLHARYSSANYSVEALSGTGSNVLIPNAQLAIDVTGRAGDISRRVLLKAPLGGSTPQNYVLLASDAICKVLNRVGGSAFPETGCE